MDASRVDTSTADHKQWTRRVFEALASRTLSRNRFFYSFDGGALRHAHRRYRLASGLLREAERLSAVPGSFCRAVSEPGPERVAVRLESPALHYRHEAELLAHEWEWLQDQPAVRQLLAGAGPALTAIAAPAKQPKPAQTKPAPPELAPSKQSPRAVGQLAEPLPTAPHRLNAVSR